MAIKTRNGNIRQPAARYQQAELASSAPRQFFFIHANAAKQYRLYAHNGFSGGYGMDRRPDFHMNIYRSSEWRTLSRVCSSTGIAARMGLFTDVAGYFSASRL